MLGVAFWRGWEVLSYSLLGLVVPKSLTELGGVDEHTYHLMSLGMGTLADAASLAGLAILLWRRLRTDAVRAATTRNDGLTFVVLGLAMIAGMATTVIDNGVRGGYDYRETVGPWFRDLFLLSPHPELMAHAPLSYQIHTLLGLVLFGLWPFTRLVYALSAPVPHIVYRSRSGDRVGTRPPHRGWR